MYNFPDESDRWPQFAVPRQLLASGIYVFILAFQTRVFKCILGSKFLMSHLFRGKRKRRSGASFWRHKF